MFEDALFESNGRLRTHRGWFSGVSAIGNCAAVCILLLLPLFHPAALPRQTFSTLLAAPPPPASPVIHTVRPASVATRPVASLNLFTAPRVIPDRISTVEDRLLPSDGIPIFFGGVAGSPDGLADSINAAPAQVRVVPPKRPAISSGVMEGRKLSGNGPRYPTIAIAGHVQGTVVLAATISKAGTIQNLRVLSGPPMLAVAAEEAVRTWRYRPYQLNGNPVDVETTVNVVFHLGD
jgi:protein TonB